MGFYQALSGLNAASQSLDVIGHNIANSSTTGFKSSRADFAEAVASAQGAANGSVSGIGVTAATMSQKFTQGNVSPTGRNLDVAINGSGFFVVQQADGSIAYTRSGNFQVDKTGQLLSGTGDNVKGFAVDPATGEKVSNELTDLVFPTGKPLPAKTTSEVSVSLNLDARATNAAGSPTDVPPVPATSRSMYGTSLTTYDSQGVSTPLNFYFEKTGANTWNLFNGLDNAKSSPPTVAPATGQIIADSTGAMTGLLAPQEWPDIPSGETPFTEKAHYPDTVTYTFYGPDNATPPEYALRTVEIKGASADDIWEFTPSNTPGPVTSASLKNTLTTAGTPGVTITPSDLKTAPKAVPQAFSLEVNVDPSSANPNSVIGVGGNPGPGAYKVHVNLDGISQYGTQFAVSNLTQDGYPSGVLNEITIASDGSIVALYSNGVSRVEAKLALADFRNPQGLQSIGGNKWLATADAGTAVIDFPGTGTLGSLQSGALEESNVDLTAELVNMMTAQRAYQANAQAIKTQDQVFSTLVNLR